MNKVRCAIYTRKSSEEGLEQDFNSLHAQREACSAYILSQASEGWALLPNEYDDGGLSGGTLERPALKRLLADVEAGKIDIVVVYKVDRLTRSLLDFSKLVEAFDKADTSFVSVTQSFNTTTSMGRLTLNMLLSFAQFEREVTAERIRDKIAASKAKGMWMGGVVPLGYEADGRTLKVREEHAQLVRELFRRYLAVGNVRELAARLVEDGIRNPMRFTRSGRQIGGGNFCRGQLYAVLSNPVYVGQVRHKGAVHKGQHRAIVEPDVWDQVRALLSQNTNEKQRGASARVPSPLAGHVFDEDGEPLIASHACKGSLRYRYYVSRALQLAAHTDDGGIRMPALALEKVVAETVASQFDQPLLLVAVAELVAEAHQMRGLSPKCKQTAEALRSRSAPLLRQFIDRVVVGREKIVVEVSASAIASHLELELQPGAGPLLSLAIDARLRRSGKAVRLVESSGKTIGMAEPQQHLIRIMQQAYSWWEEMQRDGLSASDMAKRHGVDKSYISRVVRLRFLSPKIVEQILGGEQLPSLNARRLLGLRELQLGWAKQEAELLAS